MKRLVLVLCALLLAASSQAHADGGGLWASTASPTEILCRSTASTPTATTGEEILATCTIPAGKLAVDGQAIRWTAFGTSAANTNSKTIRVRLGGLAGTVIGSSIFSTSGASWYGSGLIVRTGAATQASSSGFMGSTAVNPSTTAPTADTATAVALVVTGQTGTLAGDATFKGFFVEFIR